MIKKKKKETEKQKQKEIGYYMWNNNSEELHLKEDQWSVLESWLQSGQMNKIDRDVQGRIEYEWVPILCHRFSI